MMKREGSSFLSRHSGIDHCRLAIVYMSQSGGGIENSCILSKRGGSMVQTTI